MVGTGHAQDRLTSFGQLPDQKMTEYLLAIVDKTIVAQVPVLRIQLFQVSGSDFDTIDD